MRSAIVSLTVSGLLLLLDARQAIAVARKLPAGIRACSRDDPLLNECALSNANAAIPYLAKGNAQYGLMPMDPMRIPEVRLDDTGNSAQIAVNVRMKNLDVVGLRETEIKSFKVDLASGGLSWTAKVPRLEITGWYSGSGRILFMPIQGNGRMNITLEDVDYTYSCRLVPAPRKGRAAAEHVTVRDNKLDFSPNNVIVKLDNLFNGDKRLEDHMNEFLTENWRELVAEIGPSISEVFNTATSQLLRRITAQVRYSDIFPAKQTV